MHRARWATALLTTLLLGTLLFPQAAGARDASNLGFGFGSGPTLTFDTGPTAGTLIEHQSASLYTNTAANNETDLDYDSWDFTSSASNAAELTIASEATDSDTGGTATATVDTLNIESDGSGSFSTELLVEATDQDSLVAASSGGSFEFIASDSDISIEVANISTDVVGYTGDIEVSIFHWNTSFSQTVYLSDGETHTFDEFLPGDTYRIELYAELLYLDGDTPTQNLTTELEWEFVDNCPTVTVPGGVSGGTITSSYDVASC